MAQDSPPGWDGRSTSEFGPMYQPGYGYGGPPQKQGMSPVLIVMLTVVVMLLIGLLAVAAFLAVPRLAGTSAGPVTSTVSATVTAPESPAQPTGQPVQPVRPARVAAPSGAFECVNTGGGPYSSAAVGSAQTSCEFAGSVWSEYLAAGGGGNPVVVDAFSPVTGRTYTMSCSGGAVVTCSGGNNAVVYIY